jgi:hypothetical protein
MNSQGKHVLSIATPTALAVCAGIAFFNGGGMTALGLALYGAGEALAAATTLAAAASAAPAAKA